MPFDLKAEVGTLKRKVDAFDLLTRGIRGRPNIVGYVSKRLDIDETAKISQLLKRISTAETDIDTLEGIAVPSGHDHSRLLSNGKTGAALSGTLSVNEGLYVGPGGTIGVGDTDGGGHQDWDSNYCYFQIGGNGAFYSTKSTVANNFGLRLLSNAYYKSGSLYTIWAGTAIQSNFANGGFDVSVSSSHAQQQAITSWSQIFDVDAIPGSGTGKCVVNGAALSDFYSQIKGATEQYLFYVKGSNNRIGVLTNTPLARLHCVGTVPGGEGGTAPFALSNSADPSNDIVYLSVGADGNLYLQFGTGGTTVFNGAAGQNVDLKLVPNGYSPWAVRAKGTASEFAIVRNGTTESLSINSSDQITFVTVKITGGTPGADKILRSDATGVATWVTLASLAGGYVATSRQIISGNGIAGGGDLSVDRTLSIGAGTGISVGADTVGLDTANSRNVDHDSVSVSAGTGLTGGGTIAANRTLSADFGTASGKVCEGDDSRLAVGAVLTGASVLTGTTASGTALTEINYPSGFTQSNTVVVGCYVKSSGSGTFYHYPNYVGGSNQEIALTSTKIRILSNNASFQNEAYKLVIVKV